MYAKMRSRSVDNITYIVEGLEAHECSVNLKRVRVNVGAGDLLYSSRLPFCWARVTRSPAQHLCDLCVHCTRCHHPALSPQERMNAARPVSVSHTPLQAFVNTLTLLTQPSHALHRPPSHPHPRHPRHPHHHRRAPSHHLASGTTSTRSSSASARARCRPTW